MILSTVKNILEENFGTSLIFKITSFSILPNDTIMYSKNFYIRVLFIVCLLIVFICCSPIFATEWYKDYYRAQETAKRGDWKTTIDLLQKTIEKEPEPKGRKRTYGMHYIKYYPYLELGKAFLEIGDREKAYRFCEQAKRKGIAPKKKVEKCLTLAAPPSSAKERQEKLTELFQKGFIQPEHFDCAFKMLESDHPNPLLDGLLSGEISPEVFNRAFSCEPQ